EMIAPAQNRKQTVERRQREDVCAVQPAPDTLETLYAGIIRLGGEIGSIDCTDRCANNEVGHYTCAGQGLEHAYLHGPETAAASSHECRLSPGGSWHTRPYSFSVRPH